MVICVVCIVVAGFLGMFCCLGDGLGLGGFPGHFVLPCDDII